MLNIAQLLADEFALQQLHIQNVLDLVAEGATVPFIARYRKERTGEMDEVTLRQVIDRHTYLTELQERKETVLKTIDEQGQLTDELRSKIEACLTKTELEDLYLPYKPKRRTRATIARERGLEPLAEWIKAHNDPGAPRVDLELEAAKYVSAEHEIETAQDALQGASDILAEEVAEKAEYRAFIRSHFMQDGFFASRIDAEEHPEGSTKYEMYRKFRIRVKDIAPHNMLALRRGETEGVVNFDLEFDEELILRYLETHEIQTEHDNLITFYRTMIKDAFDRLIKHSLIGEVRLEKKKEADVASIINFEANLRELLLASPAGMKPTLGIDPGFRTGCKLAVVDQTGKFITHETIYPHSGDARRKAARETTLNLLRSHQIELIAIGNGTAGRETDQFISEFLPELDSPPVKVMVNESGASVYSASEAAIDEFPNLDVTVRGAISIARRLQDPLAELVKIDPKSIGVGQYQHDVDQRLLKKKLAETVESCVNFVGVDLNLASKELLGYVSGLTASVAKNIIEYRNSNGAFRNRRQLLDVPRFGPKAFEQASGFLRIRNGDNPLDNSAVHPESYPIVERIAQDLNVPLAHITRVPQKVRGINPQTYVNEQFGLPTLLDIINELQKPGRDPRAEFKYAKFKEGVMELKDLQEGMVLEGTITNVTNFGAFVDVGVHQDGLVHISEMANRFVKDPTEIVKVGDVVSVKVLAINEELKRINLSMKALQENAPRARKKDREKPKPKEKEKEKEVDPKNYQPKYTLDDLKDKFHGE